jgi:hypothetical protein
MTVASVSSRGDVYATGDLYSQGRTYLYGPSTTVYGAFFAASMQSSGDIVAVGDVYARGVRLSSDRNLKENFTQLDAQVALDKVLALPVTQWNYKTDSNEKHIGPMAQDFQAAFQLNADDQHISLGDEIGVALAAIQGLDMKVKESRNELSTILRQQQEQIETLKAEIAALKAPAR